MVVVLCWVLSNFYIVCDFVCGQKCPDLGCVYGSAVNA